MEKIKILVLADSPVSATGFAQVSRNILKRLEKDGRFDISVIGINHPPYYDREKYPFKIFPAVWQEKGFVDMYGRPTFVSTLRGNNPYLEPPFDLVFTIQDHFIIEGMGVNFNFAHQVRMLAETWKRSLPTEYWFKWIGYFPVDSDLKENWVTKSIAFPDYPVAYCNYGRGEILKYDQSSFELSFNAKVEATSEPVKLNLKVPKIADRLKVIPHGVDLDVFKPLDDKEVKAFRNEFFGGEVKDDTFLVVNVSRNQPRKDIARTIAAFAKFKKKVPNSHLYLHMQSNDLGGSIDEMARTFNLRAGEDYSAPSNFTSGAGYTIEMVNKIYNAADLCVTTTLGEGWGFITSEAFATKTPIVAPNITSIQDIFGCYIEPNKLNSWLDAGGWDKVRGVPVMAGSTSSEWVCMGLGDNERIRPLTNVDDLVNKMLWVKNNPDKVKEMTERAFEWVCNLTWDNITNQWIDLFINAYEELQQERALGSAIDKVNRNDPCPCGSGKKFKKCHGSNESVGKVENLLKGEHE